MKCKVHKYKRVKLSRNKNTVYKCVLCPSFIIESLVVGQQCICWYCGNTFTMNIKSLLLKPHCGCKKVLIALEQTGQGASINDFKNQILSPGAGKTKKVSPEVQSVHDSVMDELLSKFAK